MGFDLINLCKRAIEIDSRTDRGTRKLAEFFHPYLATVGFNKIFFQDLPSKEGAVSFDQNLIAIMGDELVDSKVQKGLMLYSSLDTPDAGDDREWSETNFNPFESVLESGKLFGLGASSGKLDFVCKLAAVQEAAVSPLREPIYLVGTCGREKLYSGARFFKKSGVLNPKVALIHGATNMKVYRYGVGRLGCTLQLSFNTTEKDPAGFNAKTTLLIRGESGFAGTGSQEVSSVHLLFEILRELSKSKIPYRVSHLHGGSSVDKIPEWTQAVVHVPEDLLPRLQAILYRYSESQIAFESVILKHTGVAFYPEGLFDYLQFVLEVFQKLSSQKISSQSSKFQMENRAFNLGLLREERGILSVSFSWWIPEGDNPEEFLKKLELQLRNDEWRSDSVKKMSWDMQFQKDLVLSPYEVESNGTAISILKDQGLAIAKKHKLIGEEAGLFYEEGREVLTLGAASSLESLYLANDNILVENLKQMKDHYVQLIKKYQKGN